MQRSVVGRQGQSVGELALKLDLGSVLAALVAVVVSFPASGAVMLEAGPGNVAGDQNVLFNTPNLTLAGPVVEGQINQVGLFVNFTGDGENLAGNGGQAS